MSQGSVFLHVVLVAMQGYVRGKSIEECDPIYSRRSRGGFLAQGLRGGFWAARRFDVRGFFVRGFRSRVVCRKFSKTPSLSF